MALLAAALLAAAALLGRAGPARADVPGYSAYGSSSAGQAWDQAETAMLPTEVADAFAQRYSVSLPGGTADQAYAQPIIAADGAARTDLIVATEANDVVALDPDDDTVAPRWALGAAQLGTPLATSDLAGCADITPSSGITATPVVDPATHTLYVTSNRYVSGGSGPSEWLLHGLDLATGGERQGFPVAYAGAADNAPSATFAPLQQLQRPGLILLGGVVYAAFGSHCDITPYQGWVIGVSAYDGGATAPAITARWTDEAAPVSGNGGEAGIWMAGGALTSDGPGQLLLTTGNGDLPEDASGKPVAGGSHPANLGESVVRLGVQANRGLLATDFFSPHNGTALNESDLDVGSSSAVLLPGSFFGASSPAETAVVVGKSGTMFLLDADPGQLGGFRNGPPTTLGDAVLQEQTIDPSHSHVTAWGGDGGYVYLIPGQGAQGLDAYRASTAGGTPTLTPAGTTPAADGTFGYASAAPVVTSNGTGSLTAVVWAVQKADSSSGVALDAYDPVPDSGGTLHRLWQAPIGSRAKFAPPVTDHGHVYVATYDGHVDGFWGTPALTEPPVVFGSQPVGTSATLSTTLTATTAVTVTGVAADDPADFGVGATTPGLPAALSPGQTLTVPVTFGPATAGGHRSTLSLGVTGGGGPPTLHVGVAGTGLPPPGHLTVSPGAVAFGSQPVGSESSRSVQLGNDGGTPLQLSVSHQPGAPFSVSGVPATIPPHTTVGSASVGFQPAALSASADSLGLQWSSSSGSETAGDTVSVGLSGSGVVPPPSPPPGPSPSPPPSTPGPAPPATLPPDVAIGATPAGPGPQPGYWLVGSDGGIFPFGPGAAGYGSTGGIRLNAPVVAAAGAPGGAGYWLVAGDGGVFPFGPGAAGYGSTGGIRLNAAIAGIAPTPGGRGYWLVAADGGVFPFGDAAGYGSTGAIHLNAPIVAIAPTPDGRGYWLVAADGGIFPFGDAAGYGSTGGIRLNSPVVGMTATPGGNGYWLVAADGGIFPFGDAAGYGSTGAVRLSRPIVGMAATPSGQGYLVVGADGGVFPFGDAAGYGSTGGLRLNRPVVAVVEAD